MSIAGEATRAIVGTLAHCAELRTAVISAEVQNACGRAYDRLPEWDVRAVPAFAAFVAETRQQFYILQSLGLRMIVGETDAYATPREMIADVRDNRTIRVLSTESTGGHPYMTDEDNDIFRAVHDVMGHAMLGRGFDRHGEDAAYRAHRYAYSPLARMALATETRGQNAAMLLHNGEFQAQKVAILSTSWREPRALATRTEVEKWEAIRDAVAYETANVR